MLISSWPVSIKKMSRSQFIQKQPLNADGDLDSIFWQNFPCHYPSGFAELSARYSEEAGRTLEQKHGHAPSFCPCLYQPIRGQDRGRLTNQRPGHCDTLTSGIISHCWPRPRLLLLLSRRLQILLWAPSSQLGQNISCWPNHQYYQVQPDWGTKSAWAF